MTISRWRRVAPAALLTVVTLTACGGGTATSPPEEGTAPAAAGYPVNVQSCGRQVTVNAPPQRIVTTAVGLTDTLFELGVGDRIVGVGSTSFQQPLPEFAADYAKITKLGDVSVGPKELVLAAGPDLVYSEDSSYPFDGTQGLATVGQLEAAGAAVYVSANGCDGATGPIENIYTDVENLGMLLSVEDKAAALVAELRGRVDGAVASAKTQQLRVAILGFGEGGVGLFAIGPRYTQGFMLDALGQQNVFGELEKDFIMVNPEAVIERNPQVIFIGTDGTQATTESKLAFARDVFGNTDAGRNNRIYPLDDAGGAPGSTRAVDQIVQMAADLAGTGSS